MTAISVCTLVRNRTAHLVELVEGLRRSHRSPDELVIIDMSDTPIDRPEANFPVIVERLETKGLPLARARNRAAARASHERLVFLDVDCIPMRDCIGRLSACLDSQSGLACADIRYLGPDATRSEWTEQGLLKRGRPHPVRSFPAFGVRVETNPGLFWSLGFGVQRRTFDALGGFNETFTGYGAEDTDFGYRAAAAGVPIVFVGGAVACHQYHPSYDPPVQHLDDVVANARRFHQIWNLWPMEGWLDGFQTLGLIGWRDGDIYIRRRPTAQDEAASCVSWPQDLDLGVPQAS